MSAETKEISDWNTDYHAYINSNLRQSGTDANFIFQFSNIPVRTERNKFNRVALVNATIPKTWYTVVSGQNTFTITENGGAPITIQITPGCYSRTGFMTFLSTTMTAESKAHGNSITYTITAPSNKNTGPDTGLIQYASSSALVTQIITTSLEIHEQLGLDENTTYSFSSASPLASPNVPVFQSEFSVILHSDCVAEETDILSVITLSSNQPDFSIINYQNQFPKSVGRKLSSSSTRGFYFSFQNENGLILNTNGVNIVLELIFWHEDDRLDRIIELLIENNKLMNKILGEEIVMVNRTATPEFQNTIKNSPANVLDNNSYSLQLPGDNRPAPKAIKS